MLLVVPVRRWARCSTDSTTTRSTDALLDELWAAGLDHARARHRPPGPAARQRVRRQRRRTMADRLRLRRGRRDDRALATDMAQLLVALGLAVGADRTVDVRVADARHRARSAPRCPCCSPARSSGATRAGLKHHRGCSTSCATRSRAHGVEARPRSLSSSASASEALHDRDPRARDLLPHPPVRQRRDIADQVADAQWAWFVARRGRRRDDVRRRHARRRRLGQPAAAVRSRPSSRRSRRRSPSKLAPAGLGGMALNTRFVQKAGVDPRSRSRASVSTSSPASSCTSGCC